MESSRKSVEAAADFIQAETDFKKTKIARRMYTLPNTAVTIMKCKS